MRLGLSVKQDGTAAPFPQHAELLVVIGSSLLVLWQFPVNYCIKLLMVLDHALMIYGERELCIIPKLKNSPLAQLKF